MLRLMRPGVSNSVLYPAQIASHFLPKAAKKDQTSPIRHLGRVCSSYFLHLPPATPLARNQMVASATHLDGFIVCSLNSAAPMEALSQPRLTGSGGRSLRLQSNPLRSSSPTPRVHHVNEPPLCFLAPGQSRDRWLRSITFRRRSSPRSPSDDAPAQASRPP